MRRTIFPRRRARSRILPLRFPDDERGATAIEYGLIAALISLACMMAFFSLGLNLGDIFMTAANAMG